MPCSLILNLLCQLTQDLNSEAPLNGCPRATGWLLVAALGTVSLCVGPPSFFLNHRWPPRRPRMFVCLQENLSSFSSGLIVHVSFLPPTGEGRKLSRWPLRPRQPCRPSWLARGPLRVHTQQDPTASLRNPVPVCRPPVRAASGAGSRDDRTWLFVPDCPGLMAGIAADSCHL